jgi:hypothetical protein
MRPNSASGAAKKHQRRSRSLPIGSEQPHGERQRFGGRPVGAMLQEDEADARAARRTASRCA